jgi:protein-S-isoprenylcysteine O-methyltransferase Ste14
MERKSGKLLLAGTIFAYCLIGAEIIVMISPFALYFYSIYGPILNLLASSPMTNWLTEFFLPHLVFPDSLLLTALSYLQVCLVLGLVLFFSAAIPLYYGRFTGKGVVQRGFYARIRHPQYLFLALSGFGLLLYWPRFIILILYVTMLYVYYLLAHNEEWRMQQEQPLTYEAYMRSTSMFLPGEPGGRIFRLFFGWIKPWWLGLFASYFCVMSISILLALSLRNFAISTIPSTLESQTGVMLVSVFPRQASEMRAMYQVALENAGVRQALDAKKGVNLIYLMPGDFFLMALVTDENRLFSDDMISRFPEMLEWHAHKFRGGLGKFFRIFYNFVKTLSRMPTDYETERLVFVQVKMPNGPAVAPQNVFDLGLQRVPALIVDIDSDSRQVRSVVRTSESNKWGSMPMPTF